MTDKVEMSESEKKKEDWMNAKWRPMMGWMYMVVCFCDFVVFPVLWSLLHAVLRTANMVQWQPLTLQGAGLFHIAMGAVLGIAALGRTQEKLAGANNGGATTSAPTTGFSLPTPAPATSGGFGGFGSASPSMPSPGGFGSAPSPAPTPSFGGNSGFGANSTPALTASGKKIVPTDDPVL